VGIIDDMKAAFSYAIEDFDEVLTAKSFASTWMGGVASQSWATTASFMGDWQSPTTSGGTGSGREESGREVRSQAVVYCAVDQEVNEGNRTFLQHSVDFVKGSLALIRYLTASSPRYMPSGALDGDRFGGRFVSEKA